MRSVGSDSSAKLSRYRGKRKFDRTPEPEGSGERDRADAAPRFVIQEHDATRLHWDLRLEHEGTLASWALPRGLPTDPSQNRLAVRTEDHPVSYLEFEGTIPAGQYGAGEMRIVDTGTYRCEKWSEQKITFHLEGTRLSGKFSVFQTSGSDWMIHRYKAIPGFEPIPATIDPMLATLARGLPDDAESFAYEIKWDGMRAVAISEGGTIKLVSRTGRDVTGAFPEVKPLGRAIGMRGVVLDGELVVLDEQGHADFQRLQSRMNVGASRVSEQLIRSAPVTYLAFDLLYLGGVSLLDEPYEDRRRRLFELELEGAAWRTPANHVGPPGPFVEAARELGIEGVIAKRLGSPYRPGRRGRDWLKVKNVRRQELVIGGWTPGKGRRATSIGALLVGYWEGDDRERELRYAGRVGTGFSDRTLAALARELEPLRIDRSPFSGRQPPRDALFATPEMVAEIEFAEWTRAGTLRAPVFKGLRRDKPARDVRREVPVD